MNYLKKNWKWFVTTILGILAFTIPTYYPVVMNSLDLRYEILSSYQIVSTGNNESNEISVSYNNVEINNPYITEIKIVNTGSTPIIPEMYESNTVIYFGEQSNLIESKITKKIPEGISTTIIQNKNAIELTPSLLNPSDYIIIRAITSEIEPSITLSTRIAGLKYLRPVGNKNTLKNFIYIVACSTLAILFSVGYAITSTLYIGRKRESNVINLSPKLILFLALCSILSSLVMMTIISDYFEEHFGTGIWFYSIAIFILLIVGEMIMRIFKLHKQDEPIN